MMNIIAYFVKDHPPLHLALPPPFTTHGFLFNSGQFTRPRLSVSPRGYATALRTDTVLARRLQYICGTF